MKKNQISKVQMQEIVRFLTSCITSKDKRFNSYWNEFKQDKKAMKLVADIAIREIRNYRSDYINSFMLQIILCEALAVAYNEKYPNEIMPQSMVMSKPHMKKSSSLCDLPSLQFIYTVEGDTTNLIHINSERLMDVIDESILDQFLLSKLDIDLSEDLMPQTYLCDLKSDINDTSYDTIIKEMVYPQVSLWLAQWSFDHQPRMYQLYFNGDLIFVLSPNGGVVAFRHPYEDNFAISFIPLEESDMHWFVQGTTNKLPSKLIPAMKEEIACRSLIIDFLETAATMGPEKGCKDISLILRG